jgi:hypothetical protein
MDNFSIQSQLMIKLIRELRELNKMVYSLE